MQAGQEMELEIEGQSYKVQVKSLTGDKALVIVNGRELEVAITAGQTSIPSPAPRPAPQAAPRAIPKAASVATPPKPVAGGNNLCANMPGVVVKLMVKADQQVKTGEVLLVLEAMKMENEIRASHDGQVASIHVEAGQRVQTGDPLISWC